MAIISATPASAKRLFSHVRPEQFRHPLDEQACKKLEQIPGLHSGCEKLMKHSLEEYLRLENLADNVRVNARMFPSLYKEFQLACTILGVEEPELYVDCDPVPNAWTFGHTRPYVVVTSGMINAFGDNELLAVLGHELGHIKAGHTLYLTIAQNISLALQFAGEMTLGIGHLVGQAIEVPLLYWLRRAELTADRAGLMCAQNIDACIRLEMRLAGGATVRDGEMNLDEFKQQIREYHEADSGKLDTIYKGMQNLHRTHPFPVYRAKQLLDWYEKAFINIEPGPEVVWET